LHGSRSARGKKERGDAKDKTVLKINLKKKTIVPYGLEKSRQTFPECMKGDPGEEEAGPATLMGDWPEGGPLRRFSKKEVGKAAGCPHKEKGGGECGGQDVGSGKKKDVFCTKKKSRCVEGGGNLQEKKEGRRVFGRIQMKKERDGHGSISFPCAEKRGGAAGCREGRSEGFASRREKKGWRAMASFLRPGERRGEDNLTRLKSVEGRRTRARSFWKRGGGGTMTCSPLPPGKGKSSYFCGKENVGEAVP